VADSTTVDPSYQEATAAEVSPGNEVTAAVEPAGDYDVFLVRVSQGKVVQARLQPSPGSKLRGVLMAFDATGQKLVSLTASAAAGTQCSFLAKAGQARTYKLVVGGLYAASTGEYRLEVSYPEAQLAAGPKR
jgi:hypothetical protein